MVQPTIYAVFINRFDEMLIIPKEEGAKIFERLRWGWDLVQKHKAQILLEEQRVYHCAGEREVRKLQGQSWSQIYVCENKGVSFLDGILLLNDVWREVIRWERSEEREVWEMK